MSEKRYCMGCMNELEPESIICPHCHYSTGLDNKTSHIAQGTTICNRYLIGKATATYNDSVIYIALDKTTNKTVTVYEFFPERIASRSDDRIQLIPSEEKAALYNGCLQSFLGLWRGIKMFNDVKCLPCVTDIINENGTAYAIAEYKDSVALKDYFAKTRKPLNSNKAVSAFLPLLNALKQLHGAGIVHGNLNPSTIQVGTDGRLNIIGFSIPQCRSSIPEIAAKPVSGFSPLEIYQGNGATSQTDIYSLMAVMYYSVTGIVLPRATERVSNSKLSMPASVAQNIQRNILDAMSRSLAVHPGDRIKKADELIAILNGSKTVTPAQPAVEASAKKESDAAPTYEDYAAPDYNGERQVIATPVADTYKQKDNQKKYEAEEEYSDYEEEEDDDYKEDTLLVRKQIPLPVLGGITCVSVIFICFIIFAVLYATVLYKSIEVPMFDNMFSSMTFLPMNKDNNDTDLTPDTSDLYNEDTTTPNTTYVTVPDFTKFTEDYIRANVSFLNNFEFMFDYQSSAEVAKGGVISQSINKNESVLTGTAIKLVISTGQPEITVPDVLGKTYEEAKKILVKEGFKVKKEEIENPDKYPADTVSNMSIEPGMLAAKDSEIILYVWEKVEEETTTTEPTTTAPTTTQPTTTAPTTTKPTTTKPSTTEPTTTAPTTTQPSTEQSVLDSTDSIAE